MYHNFYTYSSVNRHLGCFHVLATVRRAAKNIGIHASLSGMVSSGYMPSSGIAGSYDSSLPSFFLETPTLISIVILSIYFPTNSAKGFLSPHPLQYLFVNFFLNDSHSNSVRWCFTVVFICISLIMSDVKHLSMCCEWRVQEIYISLC